MDAHLQVYFDLTVNCDGGVTSEFYIFCSLGTFDAEKIKQGEGVYVWMAPGGEDDDTPVEKARYTGNYLNGMRTGFGKMVFPNGDVYEGEFLENKVSILTNDVARADWFYFQNTMFQMHGEGTYTFKKTNDIYSGSWVANKKNGEGRYEFAEDKSVLVGTWQDGQIVTGTWELKKAGVYRGDFKQSTPFGPGKFEFVSGLSQNGTFVEQKTGEEEEEVMEGEEAKRPNVAWKGDSIVSF